MNRIIKVALVALLWIIVTTSAVDLGGDTSRRLDMAHAWWTGQPEIPEISLTSDYKPEVRGEQWMVFGVDNKPYIFYEVGQSVLMLPADWIGTQLHQYFPDIGEKDFRRLSVTFLTFIPLNVATVIACFWLLRIFKVNENLAAFSSIIWLIGSTFLHYAQIPFQNNQVLLLVILGYGCALVASLDQKPLFALLGGLCLGLAILIRVSSILHVLTVSLFFITYLFYKYRHRKIIFQYGLIWLGGFLPLFLLGRLLDYIRYGSPWMTGQRLWVKQIHNHPFWSNLPEFPENWPILSDSIGIWGALFSPAKSIFIYDPLLLPCLILGIVFWKRFLPEIKLYLLSVLLNLGLHIAVTSYLDFWHGDSAWAARYHVTSVHLILLPLIPVLIEFMFRSRGFKNWIIKTIIFLSIIIQSLSIILSFALEDAQGYLLPPERRYLEFRLGQRIVNVVCKVNSSISDSCITEKIAKLSEIQDTTLGRTLKRIDYHNRIVLLPFNYARYRWNRRWTFIIWSVMLLLAISMTIHLWKSVSLE